MVFEASIQFMQGCVKCSVKYVYFKRMGVVFKSSIVLICIPCANSIRRWKADLDIPRMRNCRGGFYNWVPTFPNVLQFIFCAIQQSDRSILGECSSFSDELIALRILSHKTINITNSNESKSFLNAKALFRSDVLSEVKDILVNTFNICV